MIFKPCYHFDTGCAAYLFGCGGLGKCAVVAHEEDVDAYPEFAAAKGIHAKLFALPDDLEVCPGQCSGSVCGAGMSGKPSSTIAFEKRWNPQLSKTREELVDALASVPPKPAAMEQILRINQGRERVEV